MLSPFSPIARIGFAFMLSFVFVNAKHSSVTTYNVPDEVTAGTGYNVSVRPHGGDWVALHTFQTKHEWVNVTTGAAVYYTGSMAYFDFSGTVDIEVTYTLGSISAARVRPDSYGIVPVVHGPSMKFTLTKPQNLVVHATEDVFNVLNLLSNSIATEVPDKNATDVIYYGPGYTKPNATIVVPDGKTLYLAGGTVVEAQVNIDNAANVSIRGHGVLYQPPGGTISAINSTNYLVEDIIVVNPSGSTINTAQAENVVIRGIRSFSAIGWGDGIDVYCSNNVLIEGVFMRTSDDCIALYQHRND